MIFSILKAWKTFFFSDLQKWGDRGNFSWLMSRNSLRSEKSGERFLWPGKTERSKKFLLTRAQQPWLLWEIWKYICVPFQAGHDFHAWRYGLGPTADDDFQINHRRFVENVFKVRGILHSAVQEQQTRFLKLAAESAIQQSEAPPAGATANQESFKRS